MKTNMSRMLIETVVKKSLKNMKENPERGIRNLIDMALQFAEGRFQKIFFETAQTMLQNEHSAYYGLARDTIAYTDSSRLLTFGMNVGYNSCTEGVRKIRANEEKLNCNIPWTILVELNEEEFENKTDRYHTLINEGETLGIYTWMLFAPEDPQKALLLAKKHTDSAFCVFCHATNLTEAFLDEAAELHHVMLVVRYDENAAAICTSLREKELLYSLWYPYHQKDIESIINGDLFSDAQQLSPVFTVLIPGNGCLEEIQHLAYQEVKRARTAQSYRTIVWDLLGDNRYIDSVISGDSCTVCFDKNGELRNADKNTVHGKSNLYESNLASILMNIYDKKQGELK